MVRIAGLTSGEGENILYLHEAQPGGALISVMMGSEGADSALDAAAEQGIPTENVTLDDDPDGILDLFSGYEVDIVCLDGVDEGLVAPIVDELPPVISSYPALLPMFDDGNPVSDALNAGVRVTGSTVFVVTEDGDRPIVTQDPVPVYAEDSIDEVRKRIDTAIMVRGFPRAIRWFGAEAVELDIETNTISITEDTGGMFPTRRLIYGNRDRELRYGENPHQRAVLYETPVPHETSIVSADQLNPDAKGLSYNNYNDADGALELIREFDDPAAAVIKHTNPAGCATADSISTAYERALSTDPMSAFGGIIALNRDCNVATANQITESFKEVVVAPDYTPQAVDVLREKTNLRILRLGTDPIQTEPVREKPITGGRLVQEPDTQHLTENDLDIVTDREPTESEVKAMLFAWHVVKHVKSNAIVFAKGTETVGIGAGQMSRVDAVRLAEMKADEHAEGKTATGAVMASDAFFPFPDGIEAAVDAGIECVIQPGGSVNDDEVIAAANDLGISMVFTGTRCFRHD